MWREMAPDQRQEVKVDGWSSPQFRQGRPTFLLPERRAGPACDYLRGPIPAWSIKLIASWPSISSGPALPDRPTDPKLWTITRYVAETEAVRQALGLGKVHLLGHSWGGWLAIEYALTHPEALKTLILRTRTPICRI